MAMGSNNKKMNILPFLPAEILTDIFCRLPIPSVTQCKLVCKTWRTLIENPVFIDTITYMHAAVNSSVGVILRIYSSRQEIGKEILQFAEYNDDDDYNPTMLPFKLHKVCKPINPRFPFLKVHKVCKPINPRFPFLKSFHRGLIGSCNGLICFSLSALSSNDTTEGIFTQVCNPLIGEYVTLPTLSFPRDCYSFTYVASGFGYHLSTKEYKVVRIVYCQSKLSVGYVFVYTLGNGTGCWRRKGEIKHRLSLTASGRNDSIGYNVNGALHWLSQKMEIISFDLAVEEFRTLPSPPITLPPQQPIWSDNLCVLEGCLCMTTTRREELNIWVMLMNKESKEYSWIKKFSVSHRNISVYVPFVILKSGRILLHHEHKNILCYDPKTKCFIETYLAEDGKQAGKILPFRRSHAPLFPYMMSFVSLKSVGEKINVAQGNQKSSLEL